jgi:hypothetical protein
VRRTWFAHVQSSWQPRPVYSHLRENRLTGRHHHFLVLPAAIFVCVFTARWHHKQVAILAVQKSARSWTFVFAFIQPTVNVIFLFLNVQTIKECFHTVQSSSVTGTPKQFRRRLREKNLNDKKEKNFSLPERRFCISSFPWHLFFGGVSFCRHEHDTRE